MLHKSSEDNFSNAKNLEHIQRFINETIKSAEFKRSIFDDNLKFLSNIIKERPHSSSLQTLKHVEKEELRDKVTQLSHYKLTRLLGCGSYKCAFLLSNDHVLSFGTIYNDPEVFGDLEREFHVGIASGRDIGVFDYGKINEDLFYVEMSRIVPLYDFIKQTRRASGGDGDHLDKVSFITDIIKTVATILVKQAREKNKGESDVMSDIDKNLFKYMQFWIDASTGWAKTKHITKYLSASEIKNIAKAMAHTGMTRGRRSISDAHPGNIGVDIQNPNRIMLFDID